MATAPTAPLPSSVAGGAGTYVGADGNTYLEGRGYLGPVSQSTGAPTTSVLNANISNPANSTDTRPPPAVISSAAAKTDFANKQTQASQLNTDVQNHQAAVNAVNQNPTTPTATPTPTKTQTPAPVGSLDSQIQELISGLGTGADKIQADATASENKIMDAQAQTQKEQNAAYQQTAQRLNDIASGVYPLSPYEQNLLSATTQQFNSVIQAQQTANQAYTGQMTELMASLGINTSAPTQAIGMIQATINSGNSKIADLNSKMAISLGNLQMGFQKQDYDMVQNSWNDAAKQFDDRQSTLKEMLSAVTTQAKAATDELNTRTTTALTAMMDEHTISYQNKQLLLDQAKLGEQIRHDKATEIESSMINNFTNGNTVPLGSNGKPNAVGQAQFLAKLPPAQAQLVKGLADYSINPSSLPTRLTKGASGMTQEDALALVKAYDSSYDEKQYASRAAMQKNVQSGQYSQTINAANTLIQHLQELSTISKSMHNGPIPWANLPANLAVSALGGAGPTRFNIARDAVATEASKIYKGTGAPSEEEIKSWKTAFDVNSSPSQVQGAVQTITDLMAGRLSTLATNYQSVMGQSGSFQILTDKNAAVLKGLGIDPSAVDPTYGNSPIVKLQNFAGSSPDNAKVYQAAIQAAPDAAPEDITNYLQSQGYQL